MTPALRPARRAAKADPACVEAVELARAALVEDGVAHQVGDHLGVDVEDERVVTHYFASTAPGYAGWRWAVVVARASRAKGVTVDETALLPGPDAVVAPEWLPWSERLRPGDVGPGDLLPVHPDDPRLVPGWTGADEGRPAPDDVRAVVEELGLGRERVLSVEGRDLAAIRWYEGDAGPSAEVAEAAPARCASCGFSVRVGGPLGQAFALCANEHSPRDGMVVSYEYGCGAHSSVEVPDSAGALPEPVLDTLGHDPVHDHPVLDTLTDEPLAAPPRRRR